MTLIEKFNSSYAEQFQAIWVSSLKLPALMKLKATLFAVLAYASLILLLLPSCQNNGTTHSLEISQNVTAEGPFFEGPNTFQANLKLSESPNWDKSWVISELKKGTAKALVVSTLDSNNFDVYNSVSVQLLAKDLPMISLGAMSSLPTAQNQLQIELSQEADITEYLKADDITLILDIDFKNEDYTEQLNFPITLNLTVEL